MTPPPSIQTTAAACAAKKWSSPRVDVTSEHKHHTLCNAGASDEAEEARPGRSRTQTSGRIDRRARDPHRGRAERFIYYRRGSVGQRGHPGLPLGSRSRLGGERRPVRHAEVAAQRPGRVAQRVLAKIQCISEVWGCAAVSRHSDASSPRERVKGGFFSDFELVRAGSRPSRRKG